MDRGTVRNVLLPLAVVLSLAWAFLFLADAALDGGTHALDARLLRAMRTADPDDPVGPAWFEEVARDVTALGGLTVLGLLVGIVGSWLCLQGRARTAAWVCGSTTTGVALGFLAKELIDRPRPDLVAHGQEVYTSSYPSGHAMAASITYLTLASLVARLSLRRRDRAFLVGVALGLSALVGLSRVYLGVHYPTDVLGGWAAGTAWAALCWTVARWVEGRSAAA